MSSYDYKIVMGKKTEIWLGEEEIDSLLQGTMLWTDVASRMAPSTIPLKIRRLGEPLARTHHAWGALEKEGHSDGAICLSGVQPVGDGKTILSVREAGKMPWLLTAVAVLTLGSWCYFVFIT